MFDIRPVGTKHGVYETLRKEDVSQNVGCVFIGEITLCRKYIEQRRSKRAIQEEMRGSNTMFVR